MDKSKHSSNFNNNIKNKSFFVNHEYLFCKEGRCQNINKKNKNIFKNKILHNTFECKRIDNEFSTFLNNKNNDIIFNYINDMEKCSSIFMNQRKMKQKRKFELFSGNKTLKNKEISKNILSNKAKLFDFDEKRIIDYKTKKIKVKDEEEKNNMDNRTININNYYIMNSSYFNENFKKFCSKEYNLTFLKNNIIKIKSPEKKLVSQLKHIKSKILNKSKHTRAYSVNKINLKVNKQYNQKNNLIYKSVQHKFQNSSKNTPNNNNLPKVNKIKNIQPVLNQRIIYKMQRKKNPILNLLQKVSINNNKEIKPDNFIKSFNTPKDLDNYNNSLLTTYYKDKNNEKEIDDSGFCTISKNTSNRKYLINKFNINNIEDKSTIPCSNDKNLKNLINNNKLVLNIKKNYYSSNKKIPNAPKAKEKTNSYFRMINDRKEKINNHNLILQNLSFSNCSEHKNFSENKTNKKILADKKNKFNDLNKIINQKLDNVFIKNEKDNRINTINNYEDNKNILEGNEKIIETSSETLNDSRIYEMAKLYVQNDEDYFDKHAMEEILKNKRHKNKFLNK